MIVKNTVYISAPHMDIEDLEMLRIQPFADNAEFDLIQKHDLIDACTFHFVFLLLQNIGYDAAYDLLKFTILSVWKTVSQKKDWSANLEKDRIFVELSEKDEKGAIYRKKSITVSTSYQMSDTERERTVNGLVENLLCKEEN